MTEDFRVAMDNPKDSRKDMAITEDFSVTKDNSEDFGKVKDDPKTHLLSQNSIYLCGTQRNSGQCHCYACLLLLEPELDRRVNSFA